MRTWLIALACTFVAVGVALAADLRDGIYFIQRNGEGTPIEFTDGYRVTLGEQATDKLGRATMVSLANDNSQFRLYLFGAGPLPPDREQRPLSLCVDRIFERVSGPHLSRDGKMHGEAYLATIDGEAEAIKIARRLEIAPILRRHPGHQLLVRWRPLKPSYRPKDSVTLRLEVTNIGQTPIRFQAGAKPRGGRDRQFGFVAHRTGGYGRALPDIGDPQDHGGQAGALQTLDAGQKFEITTSLDQWFRFDEPDSYKLTCFYRMELENTDGQKVWEEFATGDCTVRIEAP